MSTGGDRRAAASFQRGPRLMPRSRALREDPCIPPSMARPLLPESDEIRGATPVWRFSWTPESLSPWFSASPSWDRRASVLSWRRRTSPFRSVSARRTTESESACRRRVWLREHSRHSVGGWVILRTDTASTVGPAEAGRTPCPTGSGRLGPPGSICTAAPPTGGATGSTGIPGPDTAAPHRATEPTPGARPLAEVCTRPCSGAIPSRTPGDPIGRTIPGVPSGTGRGMQGAAVGWPPVVGHRPGVGTFPGVPG